MMNANFQQLVDSLSLTPFPIAVLPKIALLIEQQTSESFSSFVSESTQSLLTLKHWAWQRLGQDSLQWINQPHYINFLHTLASFNQNLIFKYDCIDDETKALLLIPNTLGNINGIFEQINQSNDDNDPFIIIINLWFDNLSLFITENPQFDRSPSICYINQFLARNYLMTNQFKFYLIQLQQEPIFSAKQLFYIKTCSYSLSSYLTAHVQKFPFTADEMLHHISNEYLQIINMYSQTIELWDKELPACIAHLTAFIRSCSWWCGEKSVDMKIIFPTEQILCDYMKGLIRILSYKPFYKEIQPNRSNSETILLDIILKYILAILNSQIIHWFLRSDPLLPDALLMIVENSTFDEISLCAYAVLGEILTDEKVKELKATDNISGFFQNILVQAWHHPRKRYKQIPLFELLRGKTI